MTMKTNTVAGFASLVLAVLPLVVIAGLLSDRRLTFVGRRST